MLQICKGGAWREITACSIRGSGAWRSLVTIKIFKGGSWRTIANFTPPTPPAGGGTGGGGGGGGGTGGGTGGGGTMTLTVSPTIGSRDGASSTQTSTAITATPSGGRVPITYAWSFVSTDSAGFAINSPTLATTTVTASGLPANDGTSSVTIHCVGTDSLGVVATSNSATLSFTRAATGP